MMVNQIANQTVQTRSWGVERHLIPAAEWTGLAELQAEYELALANQQMAVDREKWVAKARQNGRDQLGRERL